MIKVGIVGGTGYTGSELLRILALHPKVELNAITSRGEVGQPVADMFPALRKRVNIAFTEPTFESLKGCDLVFFATPHGVCMAQAAELVNAGIRVVDLGADFRLKNTAEFEQWYGMPHSEPALLEEAVYGLIEAHRDAVRKARLVGLAGCYPTSVQLALKPLLTAGAPLIDETSIIADCKSGVSGAGRKATVGSLFAEASENFKAYGVSGHRHLPEIEQGLAMISGRKTHITFTPHLVPMVRGILATVYVKLNEAGQATDLQALYEHHYQHEYFVDVMPKGSLPETKHVRGSNFVRLAIHRPQGRDTAVILATIDNLVKGAAGQAVQAMNVMFDLPEHLGLEQLPLAP
ncbi:MAG TPA: N-acetyl-gamma-glutamyl-phosphate reductase [Limnobacter sp.]|uniref:N-acetyl-gamma-glutamyl-phosphate reductase n=1 Tax=Limnobacter sp. TaxID=2003368 RepID=UPI002ED96957